MKEVSAIPDEASIHKIRGISNQVETGVSQFISSRFPDQIEEFPAT